MLYLHSLKHHFQLNGLPLQNHRPIPPGKLCDFNERKGNLYTHTGFEESSIKSKLILTRSERLNKNNPIDIFGMLCFH